MYPIYVPPQLAPPAPIPVLPIFELNLLNPTPIPTGTELLLLTLLLETILSSPALPLVPLRAPTPLPSCPQSTSSSSSVIIASLSLVLA